MCVSFVDWRGLFAGAYIARQAAKSVVASGLAQRCLVQISYAIGVAQPLSVHVDTYGTGKKPDKAILAAVLKAFDFRPGQSSFLLYILVLHASERCAFIQQIVLLQWCKHGAIAVVLFAPLQLFLSLLWQI